MTYTAIPDDHPPDEQEAREIAGILRCLRVVRRHGGWGEVSIVLKASDLVEIHTKYTEKPARQSPPAR